MIRTTVICLVAVLLPAAVALSQSSQPDAHASPASAPTGPSESHGKASAKPDASEPRESIQGSVEKASITQHSIKLSSGSLPYRATAANMLMKDDAGKLKANVFFIAYEALKDSSSGKQEGADAKSKDNDAKAPTSAPAIAEDTPASRPITFVFNGGPGAAAVWLHIGTAGPRRIKLTEEGFAPRPPYELVDNTETWLDFTDMVFIDPVGTGYSRAAEGEKAEQFYGVTEDIKWVSEFIRLYLTTYKRWSSPKFLAGESYGTTRAAGLSEYLMDRHGIALNGIALISSVLNFQTLRFAEGNDLPYILFLPSYAAIARYHKRLGKDVPELDALVTEVEHWAISDYANALSRGDSLSREERQRIAGKLSQYTGLPVDLILRSNLRVDASEFQKHLLADERQVVGRFDGRVIGFDLDPAAGWPAYDPSLSQYLPIYSSTFNDYVRRVLDFQSLLPYEVLSDKVRPWKFGEEGSGGTGYLSVVDDLRSAMAKNPYLKIMFASGYYDLATPQFATWYTINNMDLGPLRKNITEKHYLGGHMMYHNPPVLVELHQDLATFVQSAISDK